MAKWTPHKKIKAQELYLAGEKMADIAATVKISENTVRSYLNGFLKSMMNAYALRSAKGNQWQQQAEDIRFMNPELINEEFTKLLSDPHDPEAPLTKEEIAFCHLYISTGDWDMACSKCGLDAGLFTETQVKAGKNGTVQRIFAETYHANIKLRVAYLRKKPNIQALLRTLTDDGDFDPRKVNKEYLQKLILTEMDRLGSMATPEMKKLSRDYMQMLGKTFGGFTERIEVGVIDHKKSIRELAEISKHDDLAKLRAAKEAESQPDKAAGDGLDS